MNVIVTNDEMLISDVSKVCLMFLIFYD